MSIRISYVINFCRIFKFLQSVLFYMKSLQNLLLFFVFLLFSYPSYSVSLTACGALERILIHTQDFTFATLQTKPLLSTKTYEILTPAGPENHPKRVPKKAFRRAWISDCYIQVHFVKTTKVLLVGTARDSGEAKW